MIRDWLCSLSASVAHPLHSKLSHIGDRGVACDPHTLHYGGVDKPLQAAASKRPAAKADATEPALAGADLLLDVPPPFLRIGQ